MEQEGLEQEGLKQVGLEQEGLQQEGLGQEGLKKEGLEQEALEQEGLVLVIRMAKKLTKPFLAKVPSASLDSELGGSATDFSFQNFSF